MILHALRSTFRLCAVFPVLLFLGLSQVALAQKTDYYPYFDPDTTLLHQLALARKQSVENNLDDKKVDMKLVKLSR